jgi:diaminopimelate epimerase
MVIDGMRQTVSLDVARIRQLGDRHFGIGFDQMLVVEAPNHPNNDFSYRIFNNDGSEVEQCGNGARCFARFVTDQRLTNKSSIRVETAKGVIVPMLMPDGQVKVDMGEPGLRPADIPFIASSDLVIHRISLGSRQIEVTVVSMGNPHAVIEVESVEDAPVETIGSALQSHPSFPQQVNVGFMQYRSRNEIDLRVFERGVGETLACGTGACAAVVAGIRRGKLNASVQVHTHGGKLTVEWAGKGHPVLMTGPTATVFSGEIDV